MPKSVYEERPDSPPPLVDVCLRMMSKQPEARYQTAGEVAQVLTRWLEMRGKGGPGSSGGHRMVGPPPRRGVSAKPPRRGEKPGSDDTLSNYDRETIATGDPNKVHQQDSLQLKADSSIIGRGGSSGVGRGTGSSIVGRSNVLGSPGLSGKGSNKGLNQPLPMAKPLEQKPEGKKDETLTNLIDDALKEIETKSHPGNTTGESDSHVFSSAFRPKAQPTLPKWFWLALGGMIMAAVAVGLLLSMH